MAFLSLVLSVLPLLSPVQAPDPAQPGVLEELKGVRTTLEKLEKGQRMLVALARIEIDEGRLAAFEAERHQLAAEERTLSDRINQLAPRVSEAGSVMRMTQSVTGSAEPVLVPDNSVSIRLDEATKRVDEVRTKLRAVDGSIATLRAQIAAWEKFFQEAAR